MHLVKSPKLSNCDFDIRLYGLHIISVMHIFIFIPLILHYVCNTEVGQCCKSTSTAVPTLRWWWWRKQEDEESEKGEKNPVAYVNADTYQSCILVKLGHLLCQEYFSFKSSKCLVFLLVLRRRQRNQKRRSSCRWQSLRMTETIKIIILQIMIAVIITTVKDRSI